MSKLHMLLAVFALFLAQNTVFASMVAKDTDDEKFKQCENIVQACKAKGFTNDDAGKKAFWHDCMKPIVMGKTVEGVNVKPEDVKSCRQFKIQKMQMMLEKLKQAQ